MEMFHSCNLGFILEREGSTPSSGRPMHDPGFEITCRAGHCLWYTITDALSMCVTHRPIHMDHTEYGSHRIY